MFTGVNNTGGKFAASVVDTGGNLPPVSLTPVANLPLVSLIPAAILLTKIWLGLNRGYSGHRSLCTESTKLTADSIVHDEIAEVSRRSWLNSGLKSGYRLLTENDVPYLCWNLRTISGG